MCVKTFTNVSCTASSASVASRNRYSAKRIACRWYEADEVGERVPRLALLAREHGSLDAPGILGTAGLTEQPELPERLDSVNGPVAADRCRRRSGSASQTNPSPSYAPVYATEGDLFTAGAAARRRTTWYQIPGLSS